jgi:hypothetical protein
VLFVEDSVDASGKPITGLVNGAPLRPGDQRIPIANAPGSGKRGYHAIVYGERGPIARKDGLVFTLANGAVEQPPLATISATVLPATNGLVSVRLALGSNAAPSDPARRFRVRFDRGAWSAASPVDVLDTPPLAAGHHRVEVVALSSSNGAGVVVEQGLPCAIGLIVDGQGGVRVVR